jgi:hypothetical protein
MIFLPYAIFACFLLPLLGFALRRSDRLPFEFSVLTLSAVLLLSATTIRGL